MSVELAAGGLGRIGRTVPRAIAGSGRGKIGVLAGDDAGPARAAGSGTTVRAACGGTVASPDAAGMEERLVCVSAAGGAFPEWLESRTLPGIAALMSVSATA